MIAVIDIAGQQFSAQVGTSVWLDKMDCSVGDVVAVRRVLVLMDGQDYRIGEPFDGKATVFLRVQEHARAKKVLVFKKKRRHGYRRLKGFRADQTRLECVGIAPDAIQAIDKVCAAGDIAVSVSQDLVPVSQTKKAEKSAKAAPAKSLKAAPAKAESKAKAPAAKKPVKEASPAKAAAPKKKASAPKAVSTEKKTSTASSKKE